jgi:hypothetical protein
MSIAPRSAWHNSQPKPLPAWPPLLGEAAYHGLVGAVLAEAREHVTRLALVYTVLDGAAAIEVAHLEAALALWEYNRRTVLQVFGNAGKEADHAEQ